MHRVKDFMLDPLIKKLIMKINEFIFMIGGYVMLIGWWFTLSNTIAIGAYIMTVCVLLGVIYAVIVTLYSFIKGKIEDEY